MNYGDLKSHFNDLLNRSDITAALTTRFIDQGIARIQRQLRTPLNEIKKDYSITAQTENLTLPTDFLEIISLSEGGEKTRGLSGPERDSQRVTRPNTLDRVVGRFDLRGGHEVLAVARVI